MYDPWTWTKSGGNVGGRACAVQRGIKGGTWDNRNNIINKLFF